MIKNLSKSRERFSQMMCEISSTRCSLVEAQASTLAGATDSADLRE